MQPKTTEPYACGFNAHGQLEFETSPNDNEDEGRHKRDDVFDFRSMVVGESGDGSGGESESGSFKGLAEVRVVWAGWSQSVVLLNNTLHILGHNPSLIHHAPPLPIAFFGDHNGLAGTLSPSGLLHTYLPTTTTPSPTSPLAPSSPDSPKVSHVAITASSRVAITFLAAPASSITHVSQFATLAAFLAWHADPSNRELAPTAHHMLPGRVKGLVGNAVGFVLLTEEGEVFTWGDARYGWVLGRAVDGGGAPPAETPGRVEGLVGLRVGKVVAGGWMGGAVTEAGDGFLWGGAEPGGDGEVIGEVEGVVGEVARVELPGMENEGDVEIVDVAIGSGHVLVLDSRGSVWCAGKGSNGQLGLGRTSVAFVKTWQRVPGLEGLQEKGMHVKSVVCGDLTSFAVVTGTE